jgi:hypothetical protein
MRAFRVGDRFKGNHSGLLAEVTWVDPQDHFRAVIKCMGGSRTHYVDETVFAAQFLGHWTLTREGPAAS